MPRITLVSCTGTTPGLGSHSNWSASQQHLMHGIGALFSGIYTVGSAEILETIICFADCFLRLEKKFGGDFIVADK